MQGIKIQGQRLDAIALMESDDAVGLVLDGCQLTDHCAGNNICEHESVCLSDWDGAQCLCNGDHYEGQACHFVVLMFIVLSLMMNLIMKLKGDASIDDFDDKASASVEDFDDKGDASIDDFDDNFVGHFGTVDDDDVDIFSAKYAASCEEYYQMGYRTGGIYLIDVDGSGPLNHTHVHCEMGGHVGSVQGRRAALQGGITIVEHNFQSNTTVRAPWLPDLQYHLKYRNMSRPHLVALTQISEFCEQYLEYKCQNAPLKLSDKTWFRSTNGEVVDYIGSHKSGYCTCPMHMGCDGANCYCDLNHDNYRYDKGYNTERRQLPLMEMTFAQTQPSGVAHMTLGSLKCWGSVSQPYGQSVTITQSGNFLKLHPWHTGDLRVVFKTHSANAVLFYQAGQRGNAFYVTIDTAHSMKVFFQRNIHRISRQLQSLQPLNEGNWHSLVLEWDKFNLRITLDSTKLLLDLPKDFWFEDRDTSVIDGEKHLYLAGLPDRVPLAELGLIGMKGFTGCIYGFVYNDVPLDLGNLVDGRFVQPYFEKRLPEYFG
ncbi:laminin alpha-2 chain [Plakobranchus ocellatus]|uniref:Laminin alpha-2 chain n=1 Tax=Plakobranchus ocellatus TaxID=259542 RepID=A0AAV4BK04_9GAST|nr:laminin alpha-2 chain [Plakobranchus ocellatus]